MLNIILQSLGLDLEIPLFRSCNGYAKFYQNIPKGSRDRASFTFFQILNLGKPRPIPNNIWQSHWLQLIKTSVYAKFHDNILHSSRDRAIFIFFQNLELGKASTDEKCQFTISWARSCQYQCLSKYTTQFRGQDHFHFFKIWHLAKRRPIINVILQFLGLDLFQRQILCNILSNYSKRFSEFEPRHYLDQSQMSFDNLMGYNLSIYQCVCKISSQYSTLFKR